MIKPTVCHMSRSWSPRSRRRYRTAPAKPVAQAARLWADRHHSRPADPAGGAPRSGWKRVRRQGAAVVNDGDSITLGDRAHPHARHRCAGISPRPAAGTARTMPAARCRARRWCALIAGRPVSCSGWQRDRYGRLLGDCKAGGTDLNRAQVRGGLGRCLRRLRGRGSDCPRGKGRYLGRHVRPAAGLARQPSRRGRRSESTARWRRSAMPCGKSFASGDERRMVRGSEREE